MHAWLLRLSSDSVCFWDNWFHLLLHCCHFCQDAFEVASKCRESLWCLLCEKGGNTGLKWPDISRSLKLAVQGSHLIREVDFGGIICRASAIVWHSVTNYTMFCDTLWRYDVIWLIWYDIISYDMTWYNMLDMIWYDMIWYDMIWHDMKWHDMICCNYCICCHLLLLFWLFSIVSYKLIPHADYRAINHCTILQLCPGWQLSWTREVFIEISSPSKLDGFG